MRDLFKVQGYQKGLGMKPLPQYTLGSCQDIQGLSKLRIRPKSDRRNTNFDEP